MVVGSFLENGFEATLSSKIIWKGKFSVFCNLWMRKLKQFSGKVRHDIKNYSFQNLVIGTFLQNGSEASLCSRTTIVGIWKQHFIVFCIFLIGKVKIIIWEKEAKCWKLSKSKFGQRKCLRTWFWGYLGLKRKCSERLERVFFRFLQILSD